MARKLLAMLICACVLTGAASCSKQDGIANPSQDVTVEESNSNDVAMQTLPTQTPPITPEESPAAINSADAEAANLHKLCKVWGFVKYTHLAFLTGEKDWDEELLGLIPLVQSAEEDEVNDTLYDWFVSLGDDGYDGHGSSYYVIQTKEFPDLSRRDNRQLSDFSNHLDELARNYWLSTISMTREENHTIYTYRIDNNHLQSFLSLTENQNWMHSLTAVTVEEMSTRCMANTIWTTDESYLGARLSAALTRFQEIPIMDLSKAPVTFNDIRACVFSNEKGSSIIGVENRLLGLFRLWNAIEYYYPYKDIKDCTV